MCRAYLGRRVPRQEVGRCQVDLGKLNDSERERVLSKMKDKDAWGRYSVLRPWV